MCSYANFSLRPLKVMILAVKMVDSQQHHPRDSVHWHWQLQASWFTFSFLTPPSTDIPSNTSVERFPALLLHKRGTFFLSSWFLQGVSPEGQSSPGHKGCNRRTPWLTSKRSPSWDCISLHPLFLSPAVILGECLSCSHVLITEMW